MHARNTVVIAAVAGDATSRIQSAIETVSTTGGGRVTLGEGTHSCRGLRLRTGVDLHLAEGAVLQPVPDYEAYAGNKVGVIAEDSDRALIVAAGADRVSITGKGTIAAPGRAYIVGDDRQIGTYTPARHRPRVVVFEDCADVALLGIRITDSPMWTLHFVACTGLTVSGVTVENDRRLPNTDGLVIDSCEQVLVENVRISTADDGICLKTTRRAAGIGRCQDVTIRRCQVESQSCALKIGTETFGDIEGVVFEDCAVVDSNRALGVFSRDGGKISNVRFSRITLDCHETRDGYWGSGEALTVSVLDRRPKPQAGAVTGLVVEDISGTMEGAINLVATAPAGISGVTLSRIALTQRPGFLGTSRRYDLRPTAADLAPAPNAQGRANAWVKDERGQIVGLVPYPGGMPGLYASGVAGLVLDQVEIKRPAALPLHWNPNATVVE